MKKKKWEAFWNTLAREGGNREFKKMSTWFIGQSTPSLQPALSFSHRLSLQKYLIMKQHPTGMAFWMNTC